MLKKTPRGTELSQDALEQMKRRIKHPEAFHDVRLAQEDRNKLLAHVEYLEFKIELLDDECERLRRSL